MKQLDWQLKIFFLIRRFYLFENQLLKLQSINSNKLNLFAERQSWVSNLTLQFLSNDLNNKSREQPKLVIEPNLKHKLLSF